MLNIAHNARPRLTRSLAVCGLAAAALWGVHALAADAPAGEPAAAASPPAAKPPSAKASAPVARRNAAPRKDIVLDSDAGLAHGGATGASGASGATGLAPGPGGRLVATPSGAASVPAAAAIFTTPMHDAAAAGALADLGLHLLRSESLDSGGAEVNAVVSPLSLAAALGLLHAGASGDTQRELAALLAPSPAGNQGFARRLPSLLSRLAPADAAASPFVMASRVWLRHDVAPTVPAPYLASVRGLYGADAVSISFDDGERARALINDWTALHTRKRITDLLPAGSVRPSTKAVLTNAVHFKSRWDKPVDAALTQPLPFATAKGPREVPTMVDERPVRRGTVDGASVVELPFAGRQYTLMLAMPSGQQTLDNLQKNLAGLDMAAWSARLEESNCELHLPKFAIPAEARSLKAALLGLGVRRAFTDTAELQPLLGSGAAGTGIDDVIQSASVTIDESGGEAAAATAVTVQAKSLALPAPLCAVDRPFVFAIMHKPTGTPLFVGKVADPSVGAKAGP